MLVASVTPWVDVAVPMLVFVDDVGFTAPVKPALVVVAEGFNPALPEVVAID
jgi:hypothetical protein